MTTSLAFLAGMVTSLSCLAIGYYIQPFRRIQSLLHKK